MLQHWCCLSDKLNLLFELRHAMWMNGHYQILTIINDGLFIYFKILMLMLFVEQAQGQLTLTLQVIWCL